MSRFVASFISAADGVEVHASQVVEAPKPGKSFAIIDHNGIVSPIFSESARARALALRPDTVLHYSAAMTCDIRHAIALCESAVHVGVWGAAVEMSSMSAGNQPMCEHNLFKSEAVPLQVMPYEGCFALTCFPILLARLN
jgi:hypothetical protein